MLHTWTCDNGHPVLQMTLPDDRAPRRGSAPLLCPLCGANVRKDVPTNQPSGKAGA